VNYQEYKANFVRNRDYSGVQGEPCTKPGLLRSTRRTLYETGRELSGVQGEPCTKPGVNYQEYKANLVRKNYTDEGSQNTLLNQLMMFEQIYSLPSDEFYTRYELGKNGDEMDFVEWAATVEMLANVEKSLRLSLMWEIGEKHS